MGVTKIVIVICLLQWSTFQTVSCQEDDVRANWINQNVTQKSINDLKTQAKLLVKNSKALATGPLKNAEESLQLSITSLKLIAKNFNILTAKKMYNKTVEQMFVVTKNINNLASSNGVDARGCYKNATINLYNLTQEYMGELSACAIDKLTEGIAMINDNIEYVTKLLNETTAFPLNLNSCVNASSTKTQFTCLTNLIAKMSSLLMNAPVTIASKINNVYAYVNTFPTSLSLCATNQTFAAVGDGAMIGLQMTTCVLEKMMGTNNNK